MKNLLIVANWKSNKTALEAKQFLDAFAPKLENANHREIVICPSYLSVPIVSAFIQANHLDLKVGVQDVSPFEVGAYTGEVAAQQAKEFAQYAIMGHSERRKYFNETDQMLFDKVQLTLGFNMTPIFCVTDENIKIPEPVKVVAYEPVTAIGTGQPDTPENAEKVAMAIKEKNKGVEKVLYGGSVIGDNVESFVKMPSIDGVLVGGASLSPESFLLLINKC